jgi:NitT/TauT family transport system substrate-binding protein
MTTRWVHRAVRGAICLAAISLLATSCRKEAAPPRTLRVGYIPIADCSQLFVGIEKGFFSDEGLKLELVSMPGGAPILQALGSRSLDVGFSNVVSLILARDAGIPFFAISGGPAQDSLHREHGILVPQASAIRAVSDLAGKRVALNTRRNIDELMVRLLLARAGVDTSSVRFVEVPFPRMVSVLSAGEIDAAAAIEPFVTFGQRDGQARVLTYNYVDVQPVTEISTFVVRGDWLEANPDVAVRFNRALQRASHFANANPDSVRAILTRYTSLDQTQLQGVTLPFFTDSLSVVRLQTMANHVRDLGWTQVAVPAAELIWKPTSTAP